MKFLKLWARNFGLMLTVVMLCVVIFGGAVIPMLIFDKYGLAILGTVWIVLYIIGLFSLAATTQES